MKILVYANRLTIGGEQVQAVDLGAAIRDRGHEVVITAATTGPLVDWAAQRHLRVEPLKVRARERPSIQAARALREFVRAERVTLVHSYGIPSTLEAFLGARVMDGVPLVGSMLAPQSSRPHRRLPRSIPLIMVWRGVQRDVQGMRSGRVHVLEPPVDVAREHPSVDGSEFRRTWGLDDGVPNIVIVSRLIRLKVQDKLEGIERSIQAVELLARESPVRLIIVGSGPAHPRLVEKAERVNASLGRRAVILTGELVDPGPAYAVADVVVGQAQSILRGMAFGKPAIVVGNGGFSEIVTPDTVDQFLDFGWWGIADGEVPPDRLHRQLRALLDDDAQRRDLGRFCREFVCERYSLEAAARSLEEIYERALRDPPASWKLVPEAFRVSAWVAAFKAKQRLLRAVRSLRDGASKVSPPR